MTEDRYEEIIVEPRPVAVTTPGVVPAGSSRRIARTRSFSPAAVLGTVLAIALGVIGAVAIIRGGFDGPLDEPTVSVAGFDHTTTLGLIELGAAIVLLAVSLSRDRGAILFVAIVIGAAALVAAIEPTVGSLGIERSFAVIIVIASGTLALLAALVPTMHRTTQRVEAL